MKTEHLVLPMFLVNSFSYQEGEKEIFVSFNTALNSCIRYFSIPTASTTTTTTTATNNNNGNLFS